MRGGARDSFFEERLAMREIGPSYGWYVLPVIAALSLVAGAAVVLAGGTWGLVARSGLSWLALAGAVVLAAASVVALIGARRRMRNMLGSSVLVLLVGVAILLMPPASLTYEHGLLWYTGRTGQDVAREIVRSAPAMTADRVELDTLLSEYYEALAHAIQPELHVVVEGFLYRDPEEEIAFHTEAEAGLEGELGTRREYSPSKGFKLGRFYAWDTVGDAALLSVDVSYPDIARKRIGYGSWVRVTGVVEPTIYARRTVPILWADDVEKVKKPPRQPYLWDRGGTTPRDR
jgi:hypothetical protein